MLEISKELERIFSVDREKLLNFIRYRLKDKSVAEDILHDVFIRLMTSSNNNSIGSSLSPYLFGENACKNMNTLSMSPSANVNKYSSSSSSSSSSNIVFSNNQRQTNPINANIIISSRRPFKKRSQSSHNTLINNTAWYYNQVNVLLFL